MSDFENVDALVTQALLAVILIHICHLYVTPLVDRDVELKSEKFQFIHTNFYYVVSISALDVVGFFVYGEHSTLLTLISVSSWLTLTVLVLSETVRSPRLRIMSILFAIIIPVEFIASLFLQSSAAEKLVGYLVFRSEEANIDALTVLKGLYAFVMIYALLTYYTNRHLLERARLHVENPESEGFDSDSLYKLAWLFPAGIAMIAALAVAGADLPSLTIATGLIIGAIGLATKDVITNLAAGYFLMWSETVQRHDVISFSDGSYGEVTKITARNTIIKTRDRIHLIIPNNILLSERIENWTHGQKETRVKLDIWVGYGSDLSTVERLMVKAARNSGERILRDPAPKALVIASDDSGIRMQMRFFINDPENGVKNISSVVYKEMFKEFVDAEIEIPYPKLDVTIS